MAILFFKTRSKARAFAAKTARQVIDTNVKPVETASNIVAASHGRYAVALHQYKQTAEAVAGMRY